MPSSQTRPRLFVGSSVESLDYAYAVPANLSPHDAFVKVWPQGVFQLASYSLDSLLEAVQSHDFALFVFAADDLAIMRKEKHRVVRDNVLFELGLFMGRLGRERVFVLKPRGVDLHLPTDLLGWKVAEYEPNPDPDDLTAALGVACHEVRQAMRRLGPLRNPGRSSAKRSSRRSREAPPKIKVLTIPEWIAKKTKFRKTSGEVKPTIIPSLAATQKPGSLRRKPATSRRPGRKKARRK